MRYPDYNFCSGWAPGMQQRKGRGRSSFCRKPDRFAGLGCGTALGYLGYLGYRGYPASSQVSFLKLSDLIFRIPLLAKETA